MLLPQALQEWLPEDYLAYFIRDVLDRLDLWQVTSRVEQKRRSEPPYNPKMNVNVQLYFYCVGFPPSQRIARGLR